MTEGTLQVSALPFFPEADENRICNTILDLKPFVEKRFTGDEIWMKIGELNTLLKNLPLNLSLEGNKIIEVIHSVFWPKYTCYKKCNFCFTGLFCCWPCRRHKPDHPYTLNYLKQKLPEIFGSSIVQLQLFPYVFHNQMGILLNFKGTILEASYEDVYYDYTGRVYSGFEDWKRNNILSGGQSVSYPEENYWKNWNPDQEIQIVKFRTRVIDRESRMTIGLFLFPFLAIIALAASIFARESLGILKLVICVLLAFFFAVGFLVNVLFFRRDVTNHRKIRINERDDNSDSDEGCFGFETLFCCAEIMKIFR